MWCTWTTILLVSCGLVRGVEVSAQAATETPAPVVTRAPPRTLDRKAAELVWNSWLKSPESTQNGPPRRITTKSLFITPLNCEKGQRLDRNGCVQGVTVNKDEHERILLEKLNALFTSAPSDGIQYDYGDEEQGPLQLSIPIGLDPQAAPLQGHEPTGQAQALQLNVKIDKKDEKPEGSASIEAELELLKLQHSHNNTGPLEGTSILNQDAMTNLPEKPKRDTPIANETDIESSANISDEGQKELVFGHVNVDPVLYNIDNQNVSPEKIETVKPVESVPAQNNSTTIKNELQDNNATATHPDTSSHILKKDGDQTKLNPENDYSDIGEAIKLISRYAEVTTDDNFSKDRKKFTVKDDSVLGTRTKLQHRRNKPLLSDIVANAPQLVSKDVTLPSVYPKNGAYYRYPWSSQNYPAPPPDYPFRHLQDYWPGRKKIGGVYNSHENPRRHHHTYSHNFHPHSYPVVGYPGQHDGYPEHHKGYIHRVAPHHVNPARPYTNNQDLYSLLGLRHWFSSEGTSKR